MDDVLITETGNLDDVIITETGSLDDVVITETDKPLTFDKPAGNTTINNYYTTPAATETKIVEKIVYREVAPQVQEVRRRSGLGRFFGSLLGGLINNNNQYQVPQNYYGGYRPPINSASINQYYDMVNNNASTGTSVSTGTGTPSWGQNSSR